jgi:hypothetical protein
VPEVPAQVSTGLTDTIIGLAEKYPVIASILILLGSLRLLIKPIMAGVRLWTTSTESTRDDELLDKVERSWGYTAFLFLLDWLTSIKLKPRAVETKNAARIVVFWVLLSALAFGGTACSLLAPKSSVTWEASRFRSFQTTWVATLAVYDHHMDRRVAGKVSAKDAADIDAAWNTFRLAFRIALAEARGNTEAFTPDNVKQLADDLLTLIYASQ